MASSDPWLDFESQRQRVKTHTVDRLKHIVNGINEECYTALSKSGRKQDLIDRITRQLDLWRSQNLVDKWNKSRIVLNQVQGTGSYSAGNITRVPFAGSAVQSSQGMGVNVKPYGHLNATAGSSSIGRYDPYAPPRRPVPSTSTTTSTSSSIPTIRFKSSPFIRVERAVSGLVECPDLAESASATDRRQQTVTFNLTTDHVAKLGSPNSKYQLRLFCTSSMFYSPSANSFRTNTGPCPIEFPPTCEVRINNVQITANTKGLKKKPGTAPPADLGKAVRMTAQSQNRVELIYVNSQQPVQPKKYYMVVNLVEVTSVDELVDKVKKGKYRSGSEILAKKRMIAVSDDDDIVAGPQKMSLKCPLSYMRISTPCRSALCVHSQCFDATSWFSVMEQTTTYMCPVCEKVLNHDDLIVDGYFDNILRETPDSVEDVMVEADGEWHTSDNKYGSTGWQTAHKSAAPRQAPLSPRKSPPKASANLNGTDAVDPNGKRKADVEIFVLDSDDSDEEGRVKRELSPSIGSGSSAVVNRSMEASSLSAASQPQANVIDLTLDSDEDDEPLPPLRTTEKRKAPENGLPSPTEQIWKKARVDSIPPAVMRNVNGYANGANGTAGSSHVNGTISPSALSALHMQPVHYDALRDAQRAQSSIYSSRPPSAPRHPTVTSPTLRFGNPGTYRAYPGSNSPPPPPPPPPRPRQPSSGGHLSPRGRDFSSFGGASGSRWPQ